MVEIGQRFKNHPISESCGIKRKESVHFNSCSCEGNLKPGAQGSSDESTITVNADLGKDPGSD